MPQRKLDEGAAFLAQSLEQLRAATAARHGVLGQANQSFQAPRNTIHSERADAVGAIAERVAVHRLADQLRVAEPILQIVCGLVGLPDPDAHVGPLRMRDAAACRAGHRCGGEQRTGFLSMVDGQVYIPLALPGLPRGDTVRCTDTVADDSYKLGKTPGHVGCAIRQHLVRHDNQRIPDQNGRRLAVGDVQARFATPYLARIERWQVVVHERGAMDEFDRGRSPDGHGRLIDSACGRHRKTKLRPNPVTGGKHGVMQRLGEPWRGPVIDMRVKRGLESGVHLRRRVHSACSSSVNLDCHYNLSCRIDSDERLVNKPAVSSTPVVIVGAGIGGLAAAVRLTAAGTPVLILERSARPGGKVRSCRRRGLDMDVGPTVATMLWVFDELFRMTGRKLADVVTAERLQTLARHRWPDGSELDLHSDTGRTEQALREFGGPSAVVAFRQFSRDARAAYDALESTFLTRPQTGLFGLVRNSGFGNVTALTRMRPFTTLWRKLADYFDDPRLRQLFARYATYCGSSPFLAPATLMLIAHVEASGVYRIRGGIRALARALTDAVVEAGSEIRCNCDVRQIETDGRRVTGVRLADDSVVPARNVIYNGDVNALAAATGDDRRGDPRTRSLSALTFAGEANLPDAALDYHNVFFSGDYVREFRQLSDARTVPTEPTVYLCAPDFATGPRQRCFVLINAPANGDTMRYDGEVIAAARCAVETQLERCGLLLDLGDFETTSPADFAARYPATGGALYGPAMHGWRAAFRRRGSRTALGGLYTAGGSVHPGSGVPMAALSGRLAAETLLQDRGVR